MKVTFTKNIGDVLVPEFTEFVYRSNDVDKEYFFCVKTEEAMLSYDHTKPDNVTKGPVDGTEITLNRHLAKIHVITQQRFRKQRHDTNPDNHFRLTDDGTLWLRGSKLVKPVARLAYKKDQDGDYALLVYKRLPTIVNDPALVKKLVRRPEGEAIIRIETDQDVIVMAARSDDNQIRKHYPSYIKNTEYFKIDV